MEGMLIPLFLCALVGAILFVLSKTLVPYLRAAMLRKQLMRSGTEADATILAVSQTRLYVNKMPQVQLEVLVQPSNGRSFIAEVRHVLDFMEIPHFQSGRSVKVKYNPANPKQVTLMLLLVTAVLMIGNVATAV